MYSPRSFQVAHVGSPTSQTACSSKAGDEYPNPYQGLNAFGCPAGYTDNIAGHVRSYDNGDDCMLDLHVCLLTGAHSDPWRYFDGMYQLTTKLAFNSPDIANSTISNPLHGSVGSPYCTQSSVYTPTGIGTCQQWWMPEG